MGQPGKSQDHRKVGQRHQLKGNLLFVLTMDAHTGRKEVDDRGCGTAVDELNWDGVRVGLCLQVVGGKERRIKKSAGSTGVDERHDRDR